MGFELEPKHVAGSERIMVIEVDALKFVRIRGVAVSVAGGEFHESQVVGTLPAVMLSENVIISVPSVSVVMLVPLWNGRR